VKKKKNPSESPLAEQVAELTTKVKELEDHLATTRMLTLIQSQSLPIILYQYKRHLAVIQGLQTSLAALDAELSERHYGFEHAMRQVARERETSRLYKTTVDPLFKRYKAQEAEIVTLKDKVRKLEAEVKAKDQMIEAIRGIETLISERVEERRLPPDTLAELERLGITVRKEETVS